MKNIFSSHKFFSVMYNFCPWVGTKYSLTKLQKHLCLVASKQLRFQMPHWILHNNMIQWQPFFVCQLVQMLTFTFLFVCCNREIWNWWSFCFLAHKTKVIRKKSGGGRLLWSRDWDSGWIWADWQYWKKSVWADYEQFWGWFFPIFRGIKNVKFFLKTL